MRLADLVVFKGGKPAVVVEAKARPIPATFHAAVIEQLRDYAQRAGCDWALLVDPEAVLIYSADDFQTPVARIPISEIEDQSALPAAMDIWGERVILLGIEQWLRSFPNNQEVIALHPELSKLASLLREADDIATEFRLD